MRKRSNETVVLGLIAAVKCYDVIDLIKQTTKSSMPVNLYDRICINP